MAIAIQNYSEEWVAATREFNRRLTAGGVADDFLFPESAVPDWLPAAPGRALYQEYFLATEGGAVRGGFILKHQEFSFAGAVRSIAHYRLPVSEGIVDRAYTAVALQMLRHALRLQPLLFALGMGGFDRPLPRLLKSMGWSLWAVPFYFKIVHPARFLRNIRPLRGSGPRRLALDAAAYSGAGWAGAKLWNAWKTRGLANSSAAAEIVPEFCDWSEQVWERCKAHYGVAAVRDGRSLRLLYPAAEERYIRLQVKRRGEIVGWALLLDTQMRGHKQFGDMRVGSIVDGMALPGEARDVLLPAIAELEKRGVDMILSNQLHAAWGRALRAAGFLSGPSNYIFAASKALAGMLPGCEEVHINRGDGDGPIHL